MEKMTMQDVIVSNKRVLVRVDFNVPLNEDGSIADDARIRATLPTIEYLCNQGAKVILCSHLGRPKGAFVPGLSLLPVALHLQKLLPQTNVSFVEDVIGEKVAAAVAALEDGDVLLLENTRFYRQEADNDPAFAKELASLADMFVSDAFGAVHRVHASTVGVARHLPSVAGFLIREELSVMTAALDEPERPFVAILGGAKAKDKIGVIKNLLKKCDALLLGGGMSYPFLKAKGFEVGTSLLDAESVPLAKEVMIEAEQCGVAFYLPVDVVVADRFAPDASFRTVPSDQMPHDCMGMDIGEQTRELFAAVIKEAKTVIWNGPVGVFEFDTFAKGTRAVAEACSKCKGTTIIGGGDSASAVKLLGYERAMTHISTGGGASLALLEGKALPGIEALSNKT